MELDYLLQKINQARHLYVYGAGIVASGVATEIKRLENRNTTAFVVTKKEDNPDVLLKIPVIVVDTLPGIFQKDDLLLIAVPEEYQKDILQNVQKIGISRVVAMDSRMQSALTGRYISEKYEMTWLPSPDLTGEENVEDTSDKVAIYMAVSHLDKALEKDYYDPSYVRKIQVGARLTNERMAELSDEKDVLSEQNALYGELNATRWVWKNDRHGIKGLYHYRRTLDICSRDIKGLAAGKYDVILPVPFVCNPDTSEQYGRYLNPKDMEILLNVLRKKYPEDYSLALKNLKGELLYNYNILIARADTFDAYAAWLFDILSEVTWRCEAVKRKRMPRYIGRLGEILTSIYFLSDCRNFRIANAGLIWRI